MLSTGEFEINLAKNQPSMINFPPEVWDAVVVVLTIVASVVSGGGFVAWVNRRKTQAEAKGIEVSGHLEVVDRTLAWNKILLGERDKLVARIETLEKTFNERLAKMEREIETLERENDELRARCRALEQEKERMRDQLENTDR